jgi:hypothetical protein
MKSMKTNETRIAYKSRIKLSSSKKLEIDNTIFIVNQLYKNVSANISYFNKKIMIIKKRYDQPNVFEILYLK